MRAFDLLPAAGRVDPDSPALLTGDMVVNHGALRAAVGAAAAALAAPRKGLILIGMAPDRAPVIAWLGALAAGEAALLLDVGLARMLPDFAAAWTPRLVLWPAALPVPTLPEGWRAVPSPIAGMAAWTRLAGEETEIHPELALLLPTSGSTGGVKLVRLSYAALAANTTAIVAALGIRTEDRAVGHLPLGFAFGLSVLDSQLAAGGSVLLARDGFLTSGFWQAVRAARCTVLPGVPYHVETLLRLGIDRLAVPELTTILQAGGRCAPEVLLRLHAAMAPRGGRVHAMYGQTEAGPRMAVLPPAELPRRPGAVGPALPGGRFTIVGEDGEPLPPGAVGEIIHHGPGVMMGYADRRCDLARGDGLKGRLATGDLGRLDADGYLSVTGRLKRIAKICGLRLSLDDVEALAAPLAPVAAMEHGDRLLVAVSGTPAEAVRVRAHLLERLGLPRTALACVARDGALPRLPSGKTDYARLVRELG